MPTGDSHGVAPAHGSAKVVEDLSPLADTFRSAFRVGGRIGSRTFGLQLTVATAPGETDSARPDGNLDGNPDGLP
jgi:hypothetical protein